MACMLAVAGGTLLGLTIDTMKRLGRRKLSTIWVHEAARAKGIGTALIESCLTRWRYERLKEVCVTASLQVVGVLALLLVPKGFQYRTLERSRYGAGRDEVVLTWTPASHEASGDRGWVDDQLDQVRYLDERWPMLTHRSRTQRPGLNRLVLGNRDNGLYHEISGGYQVTRAGS
jgi:ribosomal protein S18 acetylase RimI-like enzyme